MQGDEYFLDIQLGPFIDVPERLPKERYNEAIDLLVDRWSSLPSRPVAIYQLGQVGAPGISDLDFVLIFPSDATIDWQQYQPEIFPEWIRQMLTHPPYCCTEDVWSELPAWYPVFNLRHLYGIRLATPEIPDRFQPGCALGMLIDYLIIKVPRDFLWIAWERPVRLRILLAMLHSLKYTIKLAEGAGITTTTSVASTIVEVDSLRDSWFELEHDERAARTAHLCEQVCSATGDLIERVDRLLQLNLPDRFKSIGKVQKESELFSFTSPWSYNRAIKTSYETYTNSGAFTWNSPESFLQVLGIYTDESSLLRGYFARSGFKIKLGWDGGKWNEGLRYHANAMLDYSKCAQKLGVPPQKYIALGYFSPPAISSYLRNYASRILRCLRLISLTFGAK